MDRQDAIAILLKNHYTHSVPSGKTHYLSLGDAIVAWSIPANNNIGRFLLGSQKAVVWELSRLWAPDGHDRNLLTQAISITLTQFRRLEPECHAVVSYADPNVGHEGFVYRAASWVFCGQCEESRYYRDSNGQVVARRKFHSGGGPGLKKQDILNLGYTELKLPGKLRFARGLTRWARDRIRAKFASA